MRLPAIFIALSAWSVLALGQAQIFRCDDEYTTDAEIAKEKSCKPIALIPNPRQWRLIEIGKSVELYAERKSPTKEKDLLKAWSLWVYRDTKTTGKGEPYLSSKQLNLFNCKTRTTASRQAVLYSDSIGEGTTVSMFSIPDRSLEFFDPVPGTIGESLVENACGKVK